MRDPAHPLREGPGAICLWHDYLCQWCDAMGVYSVRRIPYPPDVCPAARLRLPCRRCEERWPAASWRHRFSWHRWVGGAPAPAPGEY